MRNKGVDEWRFGSNIPSRNERKWFPRRIWKRKWWGIHLLLPLSKFQAGKTEEPRPDVWEPYYHLPSLSALTCFVFSNSSSSTCSGLLAWSSRRRTTGVVLVYMRGVVKLKWISNKVNFTSHLTSSIQFILWSTFTLLRLLFWLTTWNSWKLWS